jgi:hypothetical protein
MTPRPRYNLSVIEEVDDMTDVENLEIISDGNGAVYCIKCLPPDSNFGATQKDDICERTGSDNGDHGPNENEESIEFGILEKISMACANTCSCQCNPYYTKSILKTSNSKTPGDELNIQVQRRQVSFSQHEIREFDLTLGHHPAAVHGPPVMLDYDSQGSNRIVDVDEYEKERGPPRTRRQLKINAHERKQILTQEKGFSEAEVNRAWAEAIQIRRQRQETLNRGLIMMCYDDFAESFSRKYNRMLHSLHTFGTTK